MGVDSVKNVLTLCHEQTLKHDVDRLTHSGNHDDAKSLRSGITEMLWDMQKMELDIGVRLNRRPRTMNLLALLDEREKERENWTRRER